MPLALRKIPPLALGRATQWTWGATLSRALQDMLVLDNLIRAV